MESSLGCIPPYEQLETSKIAGLTLPLPCVPAGGTGGRAAGTALSTATSASSQNLLGASRGASMCSIPGDEPGTEEEEELSRDLLLEFGDLAFGGAGGDPQHPRSYRTSSYGGSQRSSLRSSRKASGDELEGSSAAAADGAAAGQPAARGSAPGDGCGAAEGGSEQEEPQPSLYDQVGGGVAVKVGWVQLGRVPPVVD